MSTRTELASIETILGSVDFENLIAYITLLSRYMIYQTVTSTIYRTVTYSIISHLITAISRTYFLTFGNIQTRWQTVIPTQVLVTVYTVTVTPTETQTPTPTPTQTPTPPPTETPTPVGSPTPIVA
ncbi:MAG: hypothetical protein QXQ90_07195 [Desulfurococcaceae archaeon]